MGCKLEIEMKKKEMKGYQPQENKWMKVTSIHPVLMDMESVETL